MVYLADYSIGSVLLEKVHHSKIADVDELTQNMSDPSINERSLTSRLLIPRSVNSVVV